MISNDWVRRAVEGSHQFMKCAGKIDRDQSVGCAKKYFNRHIYGEQWTNRMNEYSSLTESGWNILLITVIFIEIANFLLVSSIRWILLCINASAWCEKKKSSFWRHHRRQKEEEEDEAEEVVVERLQQDQ